MPYLSPGRRAITPQGKGRFGDFDVLAQVDVWDDVTAGVVLARLALPGELAFFTPEEAGVAGPLLDLLLAQDADPRVPVLALIDQRLAVGETDGWHYDDLPEDPDAWRGSLRFLDEDCRAQTGCSFATASESQRATVIENVRLAAADGATWHGWPAEHVWSLWTRFACTAFYSHPWAWNEIGFPGPAYPRGYLHRGVGARDKWEMRDQDDADPVPFAQRVDDARRTHAGRLGAPEPS